jgi:probable phosphoglycerate mutase
MMPEYPPLYLLRHGQTEWNAIRRIQGQKNSVLTAAGQDHARAQGRILAGLDLPDGIAGFASPLVRTRQTADLALAPIGMAPRFDDRLMEIGLGSWEGHMYADMVATDPERLGGMSAFEMCFASPDGETEEDMRARIGAFLDDLEGPAVIVSHGIALSILRGIVRGLDMAGMAALDRSQGVVIELAGGQEVVHAGTGA